MELKKVLIPIDGSNRSYIAVKYGLNFIPCFGACRLTICHVINDEILKNLADYKNINVETLYEFFEEQANIYLKKAIEYVKIENFDENLLDTLILRGDPSEEIIALAPSYDLIIMTLKSKEHEKLIGHVAARIISFSNIPVLVM